MVSQETELKLALTPRSFAKLAQDPLFGAPRRAARSLLSVYFDTSRHALWRRGVALRLRRERGGWVQTLKGGGSVEAGLHRRAELTHGLISATPDLALLGEHDLGKLAARAVRGTPLVPVFRVDVERDTRRVTPAPGVTIEVSLDRGRIVHGASRALVCEIEFELKRGPAWRLFELALAVAARYPVRLEHRSKAERGYELIGAVHPAPVRGRLGVIRREMSAAAAFRAACVACLNHLQANQRGVLRGADPEYLHQARVALRRLRSVLGAFAALLPPEMVEPRIKSVRRLTRALGPARDWDVFAGETLAPVMRQFPGHRGLMALERACTRLRDAASRSTRRALASRREQALLLELGGWLAAEPWLAAGSGKAQRAWQAPVRDHATELLEQYHRRALKRGRGIGSASLPRLHRLRIAVKTLRYAAGFFGPLFVRARAKPMLVALNELQDLLGAINDCASAPALITAADAAARGPLKPQARTIVSHWNAAMLADRRRALKHAWKVFRRCERFWR
jgi:inorganic triphosphatase YgiF